MPRKPSLAFSRRREPRASAEADSGNGRAAGKEIAGNRRRRPSILGSSRSGPPGAKGNIGNGGAGLHTSEYGVTDYRLIPRWFFATQPFLDHEDKKRMSIGTLFVHVVEARGLMAGDISGRSDPYVKLCLSGRYLSHGQEWSEALRLTEQTKIVKYTLDPVWDQEFTLPVRRAGAVLKVDVWDWDRSSSDDHLGHVDITIGEELLSQKPTDMWYVLEAPHGTTVSAASLKAQRRGCAKKNTLAPSGVPGCRPDKHATRLEEKSSQDELNVSGSGSVDVGHLDSISSDDFEDEMPPDLAPASSRDEDSAVADVIGCRWPAVPRIPKLGLRRKSTLQTDHTHMSEAEARSCECCIELRRKTFGEVRLKLWFQFDEFAETCSHLWPEESFKPEETHFSPNQLYRKGMLLWEVARPYMDFMKEADEIVSWTRPRRSLVWLVLLVGMLMVPTIPIVVVNVALMRIVINAYLKHCGGTPLHQENGLSDRTGNWDQHQVQSSAPGMTSVSTNSSISTSGRHSRRTSLSWLSSSSTPAGTPERASGGRTDGALMEERDASVTDGCGTRRLYPRSEPEASSIGLLARTTTALVRFRRRGGVRGEPTTDGRALAGRPPGAEGVGTTVPGPSGAPRPPSAGSEQHRRFQSEPAAASQDTASPESARRATLDPSFPPPGASTQGMSPGTPPQRSRTPPQRSTSLASVSDTVNGAKSAVVKGGAEMAAAAGAGGKKIKKLLPNLVARDPEIDELEWRLGNTKKVPMVFNEVGKRVLGRNGPHMQNRIEKMGLTLIRVRGHFHPLHARHLFAMLAALTVHTFLQLWLYHTGRFNVYLALACVAQFTQKLYKRWGKAFVLAVKEAARARRMRLLLTNAPASSQETCAELPPVNCFVSAAPASGRPSSRRQQPAFAPPGATPVPTPDLSPSATDVTHVMNTRSPAQSGQESGITTAVEEDPRSIGGSSRRDQNGSSTGSFAAARTENVRPGQEPELPRRRPGVPTRAPAGVRQVNGSSASATTGMTDGTTGHDLSSATRGLNERGPARARFREANGDGRPAGINRAGARRSPAKAGSRPSRRRIHWGRVTVALVMLTALILATVAFVARPGTALRSIAESIAGRCRDRLRSHSCAALLSEDRIADWWSRIGAGVRTVAAEATAVVDRLFPSEAAHAPSDGLYSGVTEEM